MVQSFLVSEKGTAVINEMIDNKNIEKTNKIPSKIIDDNIKPNEKKVTNVIQRKTIKENLCSTKNKNFNIDSRELIEEKHKIEDHLKTFVDVRIIKHNAINSTHHITVHFEGSFIPFSPSNLSIYLSKPFHIFSCLFLHKVIDPSI